MKVGVAAKRKGAWSKMQQCASKFWHWCEVRQLIVGLKKLNKTKDVTDLSNSMSHWDKFSTFLDYLSKLKRSNRNELGSVHTTSLPRFGVKNA